MIALTADAMAGDRERAYAAGMDDYLTKPASFEVLASALRRWTAVESPPDVNGDNVLDGPMLGRIRGADPSASR